LNVCLGINYMNLRDYDKALACLLRFQGPEKTNLHIAACYRALGNHKKEQEFMARGKGPAKDP